MTLMLYSMEPIFFMLVYFSKKYLFLVIKFLLLLSFLYFFFIFGEPSLFSVKAMDAGEGSNTPPEPMDTEESTVNVGVALGVVSPLQALMDSIMSARFITEGPMSTGGMNFYMKLDRMSQDLKNVELNSEMGYTVEKELLLDMTKKTTKMAKSAAMSELWMGYSGDEAFTYLEKMEILSESDLALEHKLSKRETAILLFKSEVTGKFTFGMRYMNKDLQPLSWGFVEKFFKCGHCLDSYSWSLDLHLMGKLIHIPGYLVKEGVHPLEILGVFRAPDTLASLSSVQAPDACGASTSKHCG